MLGQKTHARQEKGFRSQAISGEIERKIAAGRGKTRRSPPLAMMKLARGGLDD
jgi:hypothetical protein